MKKYLIVVLVISFMLNSCSEGFDWDPNDYTVVVLDANNAFYDFRTGKESSAYSEDIEQYGIMNEPWCTELPALCGNYLVTNESNFSAFTTAPTGEYSNYCEEMALNQVIVFKLADDSYALVKIVNDVYSSDADGCEHRVTLHVNYPAFVGATHEEETNDEIENVFTEGVGLIGPEGGKITVDDRASPNYGVSIEIPKGALNSDVEISLLESESDFALKLFDESSFWVKFEPSGTQFDLPVKIGIPYNPATIDPDAVTMYWSNGVDDGGQVPLFEIDKSEHIIYGGAAHFSYIGILSAFGASDLKWVIDSRDKEYYLSRKYGTQWWLSLDARYDVAGSRIYEDVEENAYKYGRLYTWEMAKTACPSGWKLPSKDDWETLELEMGMSEDEIRKVDGIRTQVNVTGNLWDQGFFQYLQGGYREADGYYGNGDYSVFWTSTESFGDYVWSWSIYNGVWHFMPMEKTLKTDYYTVKCVR